MFDSQPAERLKATIVLNGGGTLTLREAGHALSRADVRRAVATIEEHFDELAALWKEYNGQAIRGGE